MNTQDREDAVTLGILETIEGQSNLSQRHLADQLGVALGLANLYLKRCVHKGLVKIKQAPAKRYLYYLTPKGFAEKSRLTAEYLSVSFDFYRRAGQSCTEAFKRCHEQGWHSLLLCGVSELAEIAFLRADEHGVHIVGTYDPVETRDHFLKRPVWRKWSAVPAFDACLLTALADSASLHTELMLKVDQDRILVPSMLGLASHRRNVTKARTAGKAA